MKLSKREKILLTVLGMLLFWYLAVQFALVPLVSQIKQARSEMEELTLREEQMDLFLSRFTDVDERLAEQEKLMEAEDYFYRDIDDVFVGQTLLELAAKHHVQIPSLQIAPKQVAVPQGYAESTSELDYPIKQQYLMLLGSGQETGAGTQETEASIPCLEATAMVNGKIEDVTAFAEELRTLPKSVLVASVGSGVTENIVEGVFSDQITIDFYFLEGGADEAWE